MKNIAVIGLGYVGLPLACLLAKNNFTVYGIDKDQNKVDLTNQGFSHIDDPELKTSVAEVKDKIIASTQDDNLANSDIIIICVPTPIDSKYNPDFKYIVSASEMIKKHLKKDQIIILESTVSPGTCEEVILPILEQTGLVGGKDFELVHCPERIDPGNKKYKLINLPRVVGGLTKQGTKQAAEFYRSFIQAPITELTSAKAAEATKIIENTFRDINIAFVNELAKSFDKLGIDVTEVIRGASTKPFAFMPHLPGCGVGGHCIGVDPYYLIERGKGVGFNHKFMKLAREINNSMPNYTIIRLIKALNEIGKSIKGTRITLLGLAYKPDVDDIRESASLKIIKKLKELDADLQIYDPFIPHKSTIPNLDQALDCDAIVLCTAHTEFLNILPQTFKNKGIKVIIDGRNCLDKDKIKELGIVYKGIGR